jgi:hypothetical protein
LGRLKADTPPVVDDATEAGCAPPWSRYCQSVYVAVRHAVARGKWVAVVSQPLPLGPIGERHLDQQRALVDMLSRHFGENPHVRHVNLLHAVDLADVNLSFDQMHLTTDGNRLVGADLASALRPLVMAARSARP